MYLHARIRGEYIQVNFFHFMRTRDCLVAMTDSFFSFFHPPPLPSTAGRKRGVPTREIRLQGGGLFHNHQGSRLSVTHDKEIFPSLKEGLGLVGWFVVPIGD